MFVSLLLFGVIGVLIKRKCFPKEQAGRQVWILRRDQEYS